MKRKAEPSVSDVFGLAKQRVLLLGEGNLSFTLALAKLGTACKLIATTYETEEQHRQRFQGSFERTEELRRQGVEVIFGVDATDLKAFQARLLDRVIFQFPQHQERNKIHLNRELLLKFLQEAKALLAERGEVVVSLLKGQGGTPKEAIQRRPKDTWQAQEMGLKAGLLLTRVAPLPASELRELGYESTGFRQQGLHDKELHQERSFHLEGALCHVFALPGDKVLAAFEVERRHDISFWIRDGFSEELLKRCFEGEVEVSLLDEYTSPMDGKRARTYRLSLQSRSRCLSEELWATLVSSFRQRLFEDPSVEPRRQKSR